MLTPPQKDNFVVCTLSTAHLIFLTEQSDVVIIKFQTFHVAVVWKCCFIVHLFGNAPVFASIVLECSCRRIHRYVAAPSENRKTTHNWGYENGADENGKGVEDSKVHDDYSANDWVNAEANSWTYNFVEVSGHNLESSQTWKIRLVFTVHYKPVSNHFRSRGGGWG